MREGGVSAEEAAEYCRGLATGHYENFSVLSRLVPVELRADFAAVYAFCRWSDDLGDETGNDAAARERSTKLLAWWKDQTRACFEGGPVRHPVMVALRGTVERTGVPIRPFVDLIDAFEQDQRVTRYQTWGQVLDYCSRSANPVGRIVLHLGGYAENHANTQRYALSDATCTALQLINFWQDVRRDLLERDRVYVPAETGVTADRLREWLDRGDDPAARVPYILAMRELVNRTKLLFAEGAGLPGLLDARIRPVVWLFGQGGRALVRAVEGIGCATLWHRPTLGKGTKALLVLRAAAGAWLAGVGRGEAGGSSRGEDSRGGVGLAGTAQGANAA